MSEGLWCLKVYTLLLKLRELSYLLRPMKAALAPKQSDYADL